MTITNAGASCQLPVASCQLPAKAEARNGKASKAKERLALGFAGLAVAIEGERERQHMAQHYTATQISLCHGPPCGFFRLATWLGRSETAPSEPASLPAAASPYDLAYPPSLPPPSLSLSISLR